MWVLTQRVNIAAAAVTWAVAFYSIFGYLFVDRIDYLFMARAGVVAVSEPAFWAGYDRSSAASFGDYFRHLLDVEPKRAAKYGIDHYSWQK